MISGEVLKYRKGLLIRGRYETFFTDSGQFPLIMPCFGIKQGKLEHAPADPFIPAWLQDSAIQGAEPIADFKLRVVRTVNKCLGTLPERSEPLFVSHSGAYHALRDAMQCPVDVDHVRHCVPYSHQPTDTGWQIQYSAEEVRNGFGSAAAIDGSAGASNATLTALVILRKRERVKSREKLKALRRILSPLGKYGPSLRSIRG